MASWRLEGEITDPLIIIASFTVMDSCGFVACDFLCGDVT